MHVHLGQGGMTADWSLEERMHVHLGQGGMIADWSLEERMHVHLGQRRSLYLKPQTHTNSSNDWILV